MKLYLFDFDGTLTQKDSMIEFLILLMIISLCFFKNLISISTVNYPLNDKF